MEPGLCSYVIHRLCIMRVNFDDSEEKVGRLHSKLHCIGTAIKQWNDFRVIKGSVRST